jgi:RHS repeat-associated protein
MSGHDQKDALEDAQRSTREGDSPAPTLAARLEDIRQPAPAGGDGLVMSRLRFVLAGVAALVASLGMLGVSAVACEGGGGPPVAPTKVETYAAVNPATSLQWCFLGKSVNCATGNETEEQTDIAIGGRGPGLRVTRGYNGLAAAEAGEPGRWGYGWAGPYSAHLVLNSELGTATVFQDNGSAVVFYESGGKYVQGGWDEATLVKEGTNYVYTLPEQTKLEFNSEGRMTKETDRNGNSNTFTYNGSHELEKAADSDNRLLTFKYTASGLVESVTDPMSHVVKYSYSAGNLSSVTIEAKTRWEFEYTSPHLVSKITDGRGHSMTIEYDSSHRVIKEVQAGHERKWKYGTNETKITEPNGSETLETFNTASEPTKITHAKGTSIETTTEYEYNAETYTLKKVIDPNKHETTYTYDSENNKISERDPGGDERKWKYDKAHNVLEETTPEGETTTIKRNEHGEPTVVERPAGSETQKTELKYGTHGELTEEINPLGHATKYTYDAAGDKETETDAAGDERKWKYNEDSQITEETSPRGFTTKITRDEQGRPTKISDPLGHLTEYTYDGDGNVETVTDGNKHTTRYEYNEENLRTRVEEPNKTLAETAYDSEGQMTSRTDGNKHVWEYKRNLLEQVTEETNPLGKLTLLKYEKAGNLETREDPEKHTTTYKYDPLSRLILIQYSTGKPAEVTFEYNKDGKVTKMKDETGTTENTWDKLDRLTKYKNGAGKTVEYEYDLANMPTKITYPNGEHITREYDKADRLEKVTDFKGNTTSFLYNKDGQLEKTLFPTGTEETDEYAYNEADQLTLIKMLKKASILAGLEYERDNDGQVKKTTSKGLPGGETSESVLDENNRLIEASKEAYEYDKSDNVTKIAGLAGYAYNESDELTESDEAKYVYNEDGQRTKTEPKSGEPATEYTYDQNGDLTAVERSKGVMEPEIKDSYTYDGTNLRQLQDINGTVAHLTWDTAEGLPIILADETNSYIYGPENLPIEQVPASGEALYFHHDQQGSTRLLTNGKGESEAAYTYNPYGTLNSSTGTATTPLRYDAQYTNTDTGLIYLRARTYDPVTGQFLSADPALQTSGAPYGYAGDNPLNAADPTGLLTVGACAGVFLNLQLGNMVSAGGMFRVCFVHEFSGNIFKPGPFAVTVTGGDYRFSPYLNAVEGALKNWLNGAEGLALVGRLKLSLWPVLKIMAWLNFKPAANAGVFMGGFWTRTPLASMGGWNNEQWSYYGWRSYLIRGNIWGGHILGCGYMVGTPAFGSFMSFSAYTWTFPM